MTSLWHLTILETKMFFREKMQVFWTFLFPVLMIWLFGSMFGGQDYGDMTFASYFVPSWIGVNIVTTAFFTLGTVLTGYRGPHDTGYGNFLLVSGCPYRFWKLDVWSSSAALYREYIDYTSISSSSFFSLCPFHHIIGKKHTNRCGYKFFIFKFDDIFVRSYFPA
jgi:hypothetical protein